ncbi:hypothetical protein OQA88_1234 [Cercophora sp. LCS_1]
MSLMPSDMHILPDAPITTCLIVLSIYRYIFHPLRKFPGPFINAISGLPATIGLLSGRQHAYMKHLHDKYGPVVRVSPNELSFISASAWDDIYGLRSTDEPLEKDPIWVSAMRSYQGALPITSVPREIHQRQRRALAHPFSNTSCLQQEPLIQSQIAKLITRLTELSESSTPANMTDWYLFTTLDVIGDLCFGSPFGCLDTGRGTSWSIGLMNAVRCATYEQASRRIAGVDTWLQRQLAKLIPSAYQAGKITHFLDSRSKTLERLNNPQNTHRDFIYYILRNNNNQDADKQKQKQKHNLSEAEIILNSAALIAAGSGTTAAALVAATYLLLRHRDVHDRLTSIIRQTCPTRDDITHAKVKDIPLLDAVINEALRLYVPVLGGLLRQTKASVTHIDGHQVPGGTTVSVHAWSATRSERNWERPPYEFLPERWMDTERFSRDQRAASQPFSLGPRGCIGRNSSLIETRLVLCHVLWGFELELEEQELWRWEVGGDLRWLRGFFVLEKPGLGVRLTKRVS